MNSLKVFAIVLTFLSLSFSQTITIKGKIVDNSTRLPIVGAKVLLSKNNVSVTTDNEGKFDFSQATSISGGIQSLAAITPAPVFQKDGTMRFTIKSNMVVSIQTFSLRGERLSNIRKKFTAGSHKILLPISASGMYLHQIDIGGSIYDIKQVGYGDLFSYGTAHSNGYNSITFSPNTYSKSLYANFPDVLKIRHKLYERNIVVLSPDATGLEIGIMAKKPRVINTTDLRADPDDRQSMVRLMAMSNEYDLPGIPVTTSCWKQTQDQKGMDVLNGIVGAYKEVYNNLKVHTKGDHVPEYPTPEEMDAKQIFGQKGFAMGDVGNGKDSEGSKLIVKEAFNDDPRPLWVTSWGGSNTLAQAFDEVKRTNKDMKQFLNKIRCYDILGQDDAGAYLSKTYPDIFYIRSRCVYGWQPDEGNPSHKPQDYPKQTWGNNNVRNRGPLGKQYPHHNWQMEGDTPAFMHLAPYGLNDPCEIDWGGWGGRFSWDKAPNVKCMAGIGNKLPGMQAKFQPFKMYSNSSDCVNAIKKWAEGYNNDFAARMIWSTTSDYSQANHHPVAVINGDSTRHYIEINDEAGKKYTMDASGSFDPDGNKLNFHWEFYKEPSTVGSLTIQGTTSSKLEVTIPSGSGKEAHIVLRVVDDGTPKLTSYRRVIVRPK